MRKKDGKKTKHTKWRYSKEAFKKRYCGRCRKKLKKDEVILCKSCYLELIGSNNYGG